MNKKSFFVFVFLSTLFSGALCFEGPYQDVIVNNKVIVKGHGPDCASRYEMIKPILDTFKRPITVLDIGAASGYMSLRIANDYDSTCVMIGDPQWQKNIVLKICRLNTDLDNIILLSKKITAEELEIMSECEHFDVILALNILHHFPIDKWERAAKAILNMADRVIVETPPLEDKGACGQVRLPGVLRFIEEHNAKIIGKARRHTSPDHFGTLHLLKGNSKYLKRRHWFDFTSDGYKISSNLI